MVACFLAVKIESCVARFETHRYMKNGRKQTVATPRYRLVSLPAPGWLPLLEDSALPCILLSLSSVGLLVLPESRWATALLSWLTAPWWPFHLVDINQGCIPLRALGKFLALSFTTSKAGNNMGKNWLETLSWTNGDTHSGLPLGRRLDVVTNPETD